MGTFFKITNLRRDENPRYVKAPLGSRRLYDIVEEMVGDELCSNGVPYSLEVDGWGDLAWIGQQYACDDFIIDCISEQEYENARRYPYL